MRVSSYPCGHTLLPACSVLALGLLSLGCTAPHVLQSGTPAVPITIDALLGDWNDTIQPLPGERLALGVSNDADHLYVAVTSRDQGVTRQVLRRGLTLWVDPSGKESKELGIRFPLGMARGPAAQGGELDESVFRARMAESLSELEILHGEHLPAMRLPADGALGIEVKVSFEYGELVYEIKLPLRSEEGYAVGVEAGSVIGLGLETPAVNSEMQRARGSGRGMGAGRGGGLGGRGGGMRGGGRQVQRQGGGRTRELPEPLNSWTRVALADTK